MWDAVTTPRLGKTGFMPVPTFINRGFGALGERSTVGPRFSPSEAILREDPALSPLGFSHSCGTSAVLITQCQLGELRLRAASDQPWAGLCSLARAPRPLRSWNPRSWPGGTRVCKPPYFHLVAH